MNFDVIQAVCEWNADRDNYKYNALNEYKMLAEELKEYSEARSSVDQADALADLIFVAIGSLFKLTEGNEAKVRDILLAVCSANDLKGKEKDTNGKITKPKNFVGPEDMIKRILED